MASLAAGLLLAAPDARAGSFSAPIYSGGSVKPTSSGGSYILLYPFSTSTGSDSVTGNPGYGANGYASCGTNQGQSTSFTIAINSTPPLTAKLTWQPSYAGEPPPVSVVVVQHCVAQWTGYQSGTGTASGSADSSLGPVTSSGPLTETCDNTKYTVETPAGDGSVTVKCTPSASLSASSGGSGGGSGGISVSYSAGIVSGGWDGPYYFHYGSNSIGGASSGPWANNTAGPNPTFTDTPDNTHLFQYPEDGSSGCLVQGSITPMWYWNGPDLGGPPPSFSITVMTNAFCRDYKGSYTDASVDDGLENTAISSPPNSQETQDTDTRSVKVETDNYVPGEGPAYWALGPTINMKANIDDYPVAGDTSLYGSVFLTAAISGPGQ